MAFLSALFCCCVSQPTSSEKREAEARHTRIVTATNTHYHSHEQLSYTPENTDKQLWDIPPAYHDAVHEPVFVPDEKSLPQPPPPAFVADHDRPRTPPSPRSSIVSIPSTRLTDIASLRTRDNASIGRDHTGRTIRSIDESWTSSRPPSYFSSRSSSPSSRTETEPDQPHQQANIQDALTQHPVMSSDWLEVLRQDARRR